MKFILFCILTSLSFQSQASSNCKKLYPNETVYSISNTIELCNTFYVNLYNQSTKAVIVSFELIQYKTIRVSRSNDFKHDERLNQNQRAELNDYLHSGYDRGHMTPANDATTSKEMSETFLLSNMTPQNKRLNEIAWKNLEEKIRASANGKTYVMTAAKYDTSVKTIGLNHIPVPSGYYKCAWYDVKTPICYFALNTSDAVIKEVPFDVVFKTIGLKKELK